MLMREKIEASKHELCPVLCIFSLQVVVNYLASPSMCSFENAAHPSERMWKSSHQAQLFTCPCGALEASNLAQLISGAMTWQVSHQAIGCYSAQCCYLEYLPSDRDVAIILPLALRTCISILRLFKSPFWAVDWLAMPHSTFWQLLVLFRRVKRRKPVMN